jgi:hypothetical protein
MPASSYREPKGEAAVAWRTATSAAAFAHRLAAGPGAGGRQLRKRSRTSQRAGWIEARQLCVPTDGVGPRPLTLDEAHTLAERVGPDADVGKQDRRMWRR